MHRRASYPQSSLHRSFTFFHDHFTRPGESFVHDIATVRSIPYTPLIPLHVQALITQSLFQSIFLYPLSCSLHFSVCILLVILPSLTVFICPSHFNSALPITLLVLLHLRLISLILASTTFFTPLTVLKHSTRNTSALFRSFFHRAPDLSPIQHPSLPSLTGTSSLHPGSLSPHPPYDSLLLRCYVICLRSCPPPSVSNTPLPPASQP